MTRTKTKTAALERKICNQHRRMRRAMECRDLRRLVKIKAVELPALEADVAIHNAVVVQIGMAKAQAEALEDLIDYPYPVFRKSYALEFWLENFLTY